MPEKPQRFMRHAAAWRLLVALAVAALAALAVPAELSRIDRWLVVWNVFVVVYLIRAWKTIVTSEHITTRVEAEVQDHSRRMIFALVLAAALTGLTAAFVSLRQLHSLRPETVPLREGLCVLTITSSWFLTHTIYALHYAHLHYRSRHPAFAFTGPQEPNDWDFVYAAFTVGMTFQVSDFTTQSHRARRAVWHHGLVSFAYLTVIIATAINLLANA